ncbi:MAG: asparagine synthase (glutamine-hydrolyzing) [Lachnospiraceae bacterium]|nr:asparagine synthase (glutamine-hydrolyzing) [Lachnospiraceae bacterium]
MCGISGFLSKKHITEDELRAMNDTMLHRGPDDSGVELYEASDGYTVGLAQRRLSILDLSEAGHQPMHSASGRLSIVYNGEIYNFLELRKELSSYPFRSDCDTEILLAAYEKWGERFVDRLNGMFAFALYDRENKELLLGRDRIGKKPLYYEIEENDTGVNLYFASELKPLMKRPGFRKEIRRDVLSRYLYQQYINAPDTIFKNVRKLEPGCLLRFMIDPEDGFNTAYRQISIERYWDPKMVWYAKSQKPVTDYAEAKAELKKLLFDAVKRRMIADVPLGTFLSGGYDSSLITAMAQECADRPLKTFSIGFSEDAFNEAKFAKEVASHLGTDHTERYISEEEMFSLVESIPAYYDEPFADSSQIATMLVSELAKEQVTVALSGDGGDEFFCGYNIYDNALQAQHLDLPGGIIYGILNAPLIRKAGLMKHLPFRVRIVANNRNKKTKTQFGASSYVETALKMVDSPGLSCQYEIEDRYQAVGVKNWQVRRMLLDMDTYLPGDILCKVDRASMKYSLEARCPILDRDVMEYSYRIDHRFKYDRGVKKKILKDIAYDYIPKELLDRPKTGFGVPIDKWLRGPLKERLISFAEPSLLRDQGLFDPEYTSKFILKYLETGDAGPATGANFSKLAWSFFVFQQWYEHYV